MVVTVVAMVVVVATAGGRRDRLDAGDRRDTADAAGLEARGLGAGGVGHRAGFDGAVVQRGALDADLVGRTHRVDAGRVGVRRRHRDTGIAVAGADRGGAGQGRVGGLVAEAGAVDVGADRQTGVGHGRGRATDRGAVATEIAGDRGRDRGRRGTRGIGIDGAGQGCQGSSENELLEIHGVSPVVFTSVLPR